MNLPIGWQAVHRAEDGELVGYLSGAENRGAPGWTAKTIVGGSVAVIRRPGIGRASPHGARPRRVGGEMVVPVRARQPLVADIPDRGSARRGDGPFRLRPHEQCDAAWGRPGQVGIG